MVILWLLVLCGAACGQEQWTLVWEDNFDFLDPTKWDHEVTSWGGGNFEFQTYTNSSENSYVKDGILYIKPTLTVESTNPKTGKPFGNDYLQNGVLDLEELYGRCTTNENAGCYRTGSNEDIPPTMSARLRTLERFSFKSGRAEIRAKMSMGDWLWPAMWMLPEDWSYGPWPQSGEIDIVETISNRQLKFTDSGEYAGVQRVGSTLHWGLDRSQNRYYLTTQHKIDIARNYGDYFHTYELEWNEDGISWFLDGEFLYRVPEQPISEMEDFSFYKYGMPWFEESRNHWEGRSGLAPFDRDFHFLLNVAVGGTNGFIPDQDRTINRGNNDQFGKPWSNKQDYRSAMKDFFDNRHKWFWTWDDVEGENTAMQVDYVRVYTAA